VFGLVCESENPTARAAYRNPPHFPESHPGPPDLARTPRIATGRPPAADSDSNSNSSREPSPIRRLIRPAPQIPWFGCMRAALKNPEPCWRWEPPPPLSSSRADGHRSASPPRRRSRTAAASRFGIGTRGGERRVVGRPRQPPSLSSPPRPRVTLGRPAPPTAAR
jgi:hypothetical protein